MNDIDQIKKRAGILKEDAGQYEIRQYNIGNSRPFIMVGDADMVLTEINRRIEVNDFETLVILRK